MRKMVVTVFPCVLCIIDTDIKKQKLGFKCINKKPAYKK